MSEHPPKTTTTENTSEKRAEEIIEHIARLEKELGDAHDDAEKEEISKKIQKLKEEGEQIVGSTLQKEEDGPWKRLLTSVTGTGGTAVTMFGLLFAALKETEIFKIDYVSGDKGGSGGGGGHGGGHDDHGHGGGHGGGGHH